MKYLLIPLLALGGHTYAKDCPLELSANIPEQLYKNDADYDIYLKKIPIKQANSKICIEKTDIGLAAHKMETTDVSILIKGAERGTELYSAWIHNPSKKIEVNAVTHIAKSLCPRYCGYYEYQALINHPEVIAAAKKYDEVMQLNASASKENKAYFTAKNEVLKPIKHLELDLKVFNKPSPDFSELDFDDRPDPYSGSASYFYLTNHYTNLFRKRFFELRNQSEIISSLPNKEKRVLLKPLEKEARAILYADKWQDLDKKVSTISTKLEQSGEEALIAIAAIFNQAYLEVNQEFDAFYDNKTTQFEALTDPNLTFENIMANWTRYGYYYAKTPEKFNQLFSEDYKRTHARNLYQDRQRDRSLSGLIALPSRVAVMDPEAGYHKIKYEYSQVTALKEDNKYTFEDAFERIIFVYEKGAWRLEDVIKATTQGAKLPK